MSSARETVKVAGLGPADGHPAGTVHVAVASPWGTVRRRLSLEGDRSATMGAGYGSQHSMDQATGQLREALEPCFGGTGLDGGGQGAATY